MNFAPNFDILTEKNKNKNKHFAWFKQLQTEHEYVLARKLSEINSSTRKLICDVTNLLW